MTKKYLFSILFLLALTGLYPVTTIGVRLDHLIVYSLFFLYVLGFIFLNKKILFNFNHINIIIFFFLILIIGSYSSLSNIAVNNNYTFISQIENYLQPIILIVLTFFILYSVSTKYDSLELSINVMYLFLYFMCLNTLLAIVMLYFGIGIYVNYIGGPLDEYGLNVISRSLPAGRSAGFFNQPIDGGVAYSIAMLIWFYLFDKLREKNNRFFYFILPVIILGGILCGSKVSQFLGFILSFFYLICLGKTFEFLFNIKLIFSIILIILVVFLGIQMWSGEVMLFKTFQYLLINRF